MTYLDSLEPRRPAGLDRSRLFALLVRRLEQSTALPTFPAEEAAEITNVLVAAGLCRDERDVKAEAIREAADAQRQLAAGCATRDGRYEHEQLADWLDEHLDKYRASSARPGSSEEIGR